MYLVLVLVRLLHKAATMQGGNAAMKRANCAR